MTRLVLAASVLLVVTAASCTAPIPAASAATLTAAPRAVAADMPIRFTVALDPPADPGAVLAYEWSLGEPNAPVTLYTDHPSVTFSYAVPGIKWVGVNVVFVSDRVVRATCRVLVTGAETR